MDNKSLLIENNFVLNCIIRLKVITRPISGTYYRKGGGGLVLSFNKAFRHVETYSVQGNQVRTDQKRRFVLISTNLITLYE